MPPSADAAGCLSASQVIAFIEGELRPEERAQAEVHLATCDECRQLVSALAPDGAGDATAPGPSAPPSAPSPIALGAPQVVPGQLIAGKYRVERVLGQGGMGMVLAAEHVALKQRVALKFLLSSPAIARQASRRFLREARVSAQLASEHIARVLDYGLLPGGTVPFLVLEFLEGEDLGALLERRGALPPAEGVELLLQAADGLCAAHEASVIHRDIKPGNFFVTRRRDGSPLVKLLDFGIAKADHVDTHGSGSTTGNAFLGSPRYASPEQFQSSSTVDARSDIWSFGCVAYEVFCGRPPFDGDSITGLVAAILTSEPTPPRHLAPGLSRGLEALVLRCLRKSPAERPASMTEVLSALRREAPLVASLPPEVPPSEASAPRLPQAVPIALAALAALGLAGGLWLSRGRAPVDEAPRREATSTTLEAPGAPLAPAAPVTPAVSNASVADAPAGSAPVARAPASSVTAAGSSRPAKSAPAPRAKAMPASGGLDDRK